MLPAIGDLPVPAGVDILKTRVAQRPVVDKLLR